MPTSNSPAARLLGYRIRLTYVGVFCLLAVAAGCWSLGVDRFLERDATHGEFVSVSGRLRGQSTEVMHAAYVHLLTPRVETTGSLDDTIAQWIDQHAKVREILAQVCTSDTDPLCRQFQDVEARMGEIARAAHAAEQGSDDERLTDFQRLKVMQLRTSLRQRTSSTRSRFGSMPRVKRSGGRCTCGCFSQRPSSC